MAERLTIKNSDGTYSQPIDTTFEKVFNKLAELEDIMEKYDLKIEELDKLIDGMQASIKVLTKRVNRYKTDRDTWQRACELACEKISVVNLITNEDMSKYSNYLPNYFYENSKKELEDKNEQ